MTCGKYVKKYRQMKGWSQEKLAMESKVSLRTISYIEANGNSPNLKTLQAIADALDVSVMVLLSA